MRASDSKLLRQYKIVVLAADCTLGGSALITALTDFVSHGGQLFVTPLNACQSWDGVFIEGALGQELRSLTGTRVQAMERTNISEGQAQAPMSVGLHASGSTSIPLALEGYWEDLLVDEGVEVLARFQALDKTLDGRPSMTRRKIGTGAVTKIAFWPKEDGSLELFQATCDAHTHPSLAGAASSALQTVPRADNSLFLVNTSHLPQGLRLTASMFDRLTSTRVPAEATMPPYAVWWLA